MYSLTNKYFETFKHSTKKVDVSQSLSSLIPETLTQSQCIRVGIYCEKLLRIYISTHSHIIDLKKPNKKGHRERDHLFMCHDKKVYAEIKGNLNLDTEKKRATAKKIPQISKREGCDGYIVCLRYYSGDIPSVVKAKFPGVTVLTVSDYLRILEVPCPFGSFEMGYIFWLRQVARKLS